VNDAPLGKCDAFRRLISGFPKWPVSRSGGEADQVEFASGRPAQVIKSEDAKRVTMGGRTREPLATGGGGGGWFGGGGGGGGGGWGGGVGGGFSQMVRAAAGAASSRRSAHLCGVRVLTEEGRSVFLYDA